MLFANLHKIVALCDTNRANFTENTCSESVLYGAVDNSDEAGGESHDLQIPMLIPKEKRSDSQFEI